MTFGIFIFWFLFSLAAAVYATNKGRSGLGWFLISILLSPLIGLIFLAVSKDLAATASASPSALTHRKCPHCAELILPDAKVCKHCNREVADDPNFHERITEQVEKSEAKNPNNLIRGVVYVALFFIVVEELKRCGG